MDSNDRERIHEAKEELTKLVEEDELRDAVIVVFANKQVVILIQPSAIAPTKAT